MPLPKRKSIRLPEYDYSSSGYYFVTICTQNREHIFGNTTVGVGPRADPIIRLNQIGLMVKRIWNEIPIYYSGVGIDEFIIMPNHIHGIIILDGRPQGAAPTGFSLPDIIHRFKSLTTAKYRHGVRRQQWPRFKKRLWQRNYFERVIRNERELYHIRHYVRYNPEALGDQFFTK